MTSRPGPARILSARPLAIVLMLIVLALPAGHATEPPPVTVSAAVSLTDALQAIAAQYAAIQGGNVRFNFGPSNTLARQIVEGAPVDVFVSADEAQMDVVARAGAIADGTRFDLLRNQLAVVVPDDRRRVLTGPRDLLDPGLKRIAIGDPSAVPAGVYAKQYLESVGLWQALASRIVPAASVRAALAAVDNGGADAGIVYRTDARVARRSVLAWLVPIDEGPRIVYPAAVMKDAPAGERAGRFVNFLRSATAARIFRQFDFVPAT